MTDNEKLRISTTIAKNAMNDVVTELHDSDLEPPTDLTDNQARSDWFELQYALRAWAVADAFKREADALLKASKERVLELGGVSDSVVEQVAIGEQQVLVDGQYNALSLQKRNGRVMVDSKTVRQHLLDNGVTRELMDEAEEAAKKVSAPSKVFSIVSK